MKQRNEGIKKLDLKDKRNTQVAVALRIKAQKTRHKQKQNIDVIS